MRSSFIAVAAFSLVAALMAGCQATALTKLEPIAALPVMADPVGGVVVHGVQQEPFTVAEERSDLQARKVVPFELATVPASPQLEVLMTVVAYACGVKPGLPQGKTSVLINQKPVAQWSFNWSDQGKSYRSVVVIDPKLLQIGKNELEVVGERCAYGNFEIVRFHGLNLV